MFSTLRNRFGIPGVISVIALVFAMFGGAYAASNSSGGGKATAGAKAKQGPRGKTGKTGPAGPAGPAGPVGPAGPAGAKGDSGAPGTNGTPGTSVTNTTVPTSSATCSHLGGAEFKVGAGTSTTACNGETGFTEMLPKGKTETGVFTAAYEEVGSLLGISFSIPLAASLDATHVAAHEGGYNGEDETGTEHENCPGSAANPRAAEGYLCVYTGGANGEGGASPSKVGEIFDPGTGFPAGLGGSASVGAGTTGAGLLLFNPGYVAGTWAVTAP